MLLTNRLQHIFGEMTRICLEAGLPKAYHSDRFWDAHWLIQHSKKESGWDVLTESFFWVLRESGTNIVDKNYDAKKISLCFGDADRTYRVTVLNDKEVEMERVE